jgi:hypothetical protein
MIQADPAECGLGRSTKRTKKTTNQPKYSTKITNGSPKITQPLGTKGGQQLGPMRHSMHLKDETSHRTSQDPTRHIAPRIVIHVIKRSKHSFPTQAVPEPGDQHPNLVWRSLTLGLDLIPLNSYRSCKSLLVRH